MADPGKWGGGILEAQGVGVYREYGRPTGYMYSY